MDELIENRNRETYHLVTQNISKILISLAAIVTFMTFLTLLYTYSDISFRVMSYIASTIYVLLYWYFRLFRYVFILSSGIGYDLTKSYCDHTNGYELFRLHNEYIKHNHLNSSSKYYDTPEYYDYCIASGYIILVTFLWTVLAICIATPVIVFISFLEEDTRNEKYNESIRKINEQDQELEDEYSGMIRPRNQLKPLDKKEQSKIMRQAIMTTHIILSIVNWSLRVALNDSNIYSPVMISIYMFVIIVLISQDVVVLVWNTKIIVEPTRIEIELP